jgi:hypothetical protein
MNATPTQLGLAISSLIVGVILAVCTIPAAIASQYFADHGLVLLPFALFSVILGYFGRTNSMGVAGLCLSLLATFEAGGVMVVHAYIRQQAIELQMTEAKAEKARIELEKALEDRIVADQKIKATELEIKRATLAIEAEKLAIVERLRLEKVKTQKKITDEDEDRKAKKEAEERKAQNLKEEEERKVQNLKLEVERDQAAKANNKELEEQKALDLIKGTENKIVSLRKQIEEIDQIITQKKKTQMKKPLIGKETLLLNREIVQKNIQEINNTRRRSGSGLADTGRNEDLLQREQMKLDKINADLHAHEEWSSYQYGQHGQPSRYEMDLKVLKGLEEQRIELQTNLRKLMEQQTESRKR